MRNQEVYCSFARVLHIKVNGRPLASLPSPCTTHLNGYNTFMAKMKTIEQKIDALTGIVEKGFAAVATDISDVRKEMATKEDIKRLDARIDGLQVKVDGVQSTIDAEAMQRGDLQLPRRVHDLEEKVFGHSKHPKHLPL